MMLVLMLLCAFLAPFTNSWKLHEEMTSDEIKEIFQTTPDSVPEYELIKVNHRLHKRSATTILKARIFNQDKTFYLSPVEGLLIGEHTKVWTAKSKYDGLVYTQVPNAMKNIGQLYQDAKNNAAIIVKIGVQGNRQFDGTFGRNFGIRPIPMRHRFRRNVSNNSDVDYLSFPDHIVFKIPEPSANTTKLFSSGRYTNEETFSKPIFRAKRAIREIVYPEVLVFVDHKLYTIFDTNVTKAVGYIASLFNGIDLRYRAIQYPKIRINVAGIVLIEGFNFFLKTYIRERHLSVDESLDDFAEFLANDNQFTFKKDYDIALYITGLDLEVKNTDGTYDKDVAGIAYFEGACKNDSIGVRSAGLIEDDGSFKGVLTGAHELAHVMGAKHDSTKEGPDACTWDKGYIMSYNGKDENKMRFSPCSQEQMQNYINSKTGICLHNRPPTDKPLPKILPGEYLSLDDQCMAMSNTKSCDMGERVCNALFCKHPDLSQRVRGVCTSKAPAAEGSVCGDNKICLNGECISRTSTKVPGVISYY